MFFEKFCPSWSLNRREKFSGNIAGPCADGGFRAAMRVQGRWRKGHRLIRRYLMNLEIMQGSRALPIESQLWRQHGS